MKDPMISELDAALVAATNLRSLGLGAPRTTHTQEGIAVLAEPFTNSIDLARLRRIALRVIAVAPGPPT